MQPVGPLTGCWIVFAPIPLQTIRPRHAAGATLTLCLVLSCCWRICGAETNAQGVSGDPARESVTLQLQRHHQFQFAGYYAAKEQGFYAAEGLDVVILDGGYDPNGNAKRPVEEVVFGRADYGVTRSDLLLHHSRGIPVTMLANIFQRSPFVLMSLQEYGIRRLSDVEDRPITLNIPEPSRS